MFNRIKLLRVLTTAVFSIATIGSMVTSANAEPITPAAAGLSSLQSGTTNADNGASVYVGDKVFIYAQAGFNTAAANLGAAPAIGDFEVTNSIGGVPETATFTAFGSGVVSDPTQCSESPTVPANPPTPGVNTLKTFCWYTYDLKLGDNDVNVRFNGTSTFLNPRNSLSTITLIQKETPRIVISTRAHQNDDNDEEISTSGNANLGDTVDLIATVHFDTNKNPNIPTGKIYFYHQKPELLSAGWPIGDNSSTTKYGCEIDTSTWDSTTASDNTVSCYITITVNNDPNNASGFNLTHFSGESVTALGDHGIVGVYAGNDPALDLTVRLHGEADTTGIETPTASLLPEFHFDTVYRDLLFNTISGNRFLGDENYNGAVSGYNNLLDTYETGTAYILSINKGWAHVAATVTPGEPTQYGEMVTFNVAAIGSIGVGSSVAPTASERGLGIKLTESGDANAPPIYLYCAASDIVDLEAPAGYVSSGCEITTELLHPLDYYVVDAFYLGNNDFQPTTFMGSTIEGTPTTGLDLANYLVNYFYAPENPEDVNPDTVNTQDLTIANNAEWVEFFGNDSSNSYYNATYRFFNDPDDYVLTAHEVTKADPVVEITDVTGETEYGQDATFNVSVTNPNSTNTLLDYPTGEVTLTSDAQADWSAECSLDPNTPYASEAVTTYYTCTSATLLVGEHTVTASYEGDSNYNTGTSSVTHTVIQVTPVIEITSDPATTEYGEDAKFTVTISNPYSADDLVAPTGDVTLTTDNLNQVDWVAECTFESSESATSTYSCESPTLLAANHVLNVHYVGDDNYFADNATTYEYSVTPYTPEITIEASPDSTEYGQDVTFTVHVSGTGNEGVLPPAGTVVLTSSEQDDWSLECINITTDGSTYTCSGTSATLLKDNHDIIATFTTEDGTYQGYNYTNAEDDIAFSVDHVTPTIDFIANQDSTVYGQPASFTVTLDNPIQAEGLVAPTGDVVLTSDAQPDWTADCSVDSVTGSQAVYTCTSATLLAGDHQLTASYEGDDNYGVTDATISYTVYQVDPVVEITADPTSTKYGEEAHFTITVANPYDSEGLVAPTGDVSLTSDIQDWTANCTFDSSEGAVSTYNCESPTLIAGTHILTVHYSGDENYNSSDLTTLEYTVEAYTPEVTITTDVESTEYGDQVTFTVTLEGTGNEGVDAPSGTVVLTSSEQPDWELTCGDVSTDGSTYTCYGTSATLLADVHEITATFTPDDSTLGNNYTTASEDITYEVTKKEPVPTITANPADNNTYGSNTTFTVTLSGTDMVDSPATGAVVLAPTGEVTLTDSENPDWSVECVPTEVNADGGSTFTCTGTNPTLSVGTHVITASYEGDDNYEPTSVVIETYEITQFTPTITVDVNSEPAEYGDEQTITVTIAGSGNHDVIPPSAQTITLNDPASNWSYTGVPSCEPNDENITLVCTVTTTHLFAGQYPIHATYAGDENYTPNEGTSEASVDISKAVLEVTPAESLVSIDYGSTTIPALTAKIEGFKNSEDASSFVPNQATSFENGDGTETTVAGSDWFLAPTCAPVNLFTAPGVMANAGTSGVYYNCSGGNASNYNFEHSGNAAISIRQTIAQLQITSNVLTATYGQKIDFTVHLVNNSGVPADAVSILITSGEAVLGTCTLGDLSRNKCGITTDVLPVGNNTVTASWNGPADVNFAVPNPASMSQPVVKAAVGITVTSNHNPANPNQSITLTATVTGTSTPPTGSVTFAGDIDAVVADCVPVIGTNRSICSAEVGNLNPAVYHVVVNYSGDESYLENDTTYIQIVQFETTGVNIDPANTTSLYGDAVEFTVTVPGDIAQNPTAWPTGRVTISDNNRSYSVGCDLVHIAETVNSSCVIIVTGMEIGQHQILASYSGDSIFPASYDLTGHHVVINTTTSIASNKNPANTGEPVTLTATVSSVRGTPATGVISFQEDGIEIASCNVFGGTCSVVLTGSSALANGLHNIVAVFQPGEISDFLTSTSPNLGQMINDLVISSIAISQSNETSYLGQTTNFTVSVVGSANTPTGSVRVDIISNETVVQTYTCVLANGACTVGTNTLPAGTYSVIGYYLGQEAGYPAANTDPLTHVVALKGTSVSIASSKNPSLYGDQITLTSTVTSEHGTPSSGTISFESDGTPVGSCTISGGTCSISIGSLAVGTHSIIAYFTPTEGSAFDAAYSPTLNQDVQALQAVVTVSSNLNPSLVGQTVTFTVNVTGNGYTPKGPVSIDVVTHGTADFYETLFCDVINGRCSVATSDLEAGQYDVTAHYSGDTTLGESGYPAAESDSLLQTVNEPGLLVTNRESVTHTELPSGDSLITLSVSISGNAGPVVGAVSFYLDGSVVDGTFTHGPFIGTGTCTRLRVSGPPVSYTANCQIKVLASALHALNPSVRQHYVTVAYNGANYGSINVLNDGAGVSMVLHEIWNYVAADHTVTFNKNYVGSGDTYTQTESKTAVLIPNVFIRDGYTFDGWATSETGSVIFAPGTTYTFAEDITLFAHWTAVPAGPAGPTADQTVTFKANGGVGSDETQTANTATALRGNTFTRDGYTFAGWTTNSNGTGDSYLDQATYSFAASKTLFAQWTANAAPAVNHTVTFNANLGVGSDETQTASSATSLRGNTFTRDGYTFAGWTSNSDGTGDSYLNGATYSFASDKTLFAQWIAIGVVNHTVNFNGNARDSLGSMTPQTSNTSANLSANGFSRAGYTFAGWSTTTNGMVYYADGASYSFASDIVLYAQWTAANYTVTFYGNGSTSGSMSPQVSNLPAVLTVNAFSRTGYTFDGWATSPSGAVVYAPGIYGFGANIDLYAHWTAVPSAPAPYSPPAPTPTPTPTQTAPVIGWNTPASIVVGTALSGIQLNASVITPAGLSGTFTYSPAAGTLLPVGTYTLTVTFTPTDTVNYTTVTKTVSQVVTPLGAGPITPAGSTDAKITLGNGNGTYDKTPHPVPVSIAPANCLYTITYNGSTTVPVNAGTYNVIVTAYGNCTGIATTTLVIDKAVPNVDWTDPADITNVTPLGPVQLNPTADVPGSFTFSPSAGTRLPAGVQLLGATFTPADSTNYTSVNVNANINVTATILTQTIVSTFALGSSLITPDQLAIIATASVTPGQRIVITGYAQPSNNPAADLKLGLSRANAVKAQILKRNPKAKVTVKTLGAQYQPLCAKATNKCVVINLK